MKAQDIVDGILQGERYANSKLFDDKIYVDEPIIRTGASAFGPLTAHPRERRTALLPELVAIRRLARRKKHSAWGYSYTADSAKLFVEQARLVADYEDDYDGALDTGKIRGAYIGYEELSDHQLRCYFAWRTRVRRGERPPAPAAFVRLYAYELLNGIGMEPGEEGLAELKMLADTYISEEFAKELFAAWQRDYVVYYDLDARLLLEVAGDGLSAASAVAILRRAEAAILAGTGESCDWREVRGAGHGEVGRTGVPVGASCADMAKKGGEAPAKQSLNAMPSPEELLDALVRLSRYRADRSRFFRDRREDVAWVVSRVFADMVRHCSKRRKVGLVDGWFGKSMRVSYTIFRSAMFWTDMPHGDATYEVGPYESYICARGFWWHELPGRRLERHVELGTLLHAIDARMRRATQDNHPLKDRPLPKYQARFVDKHIDELVELRAAEEAARITIDRSVLRSIRSAALRTREALLTDEERAEDETTFVAIPAAGSVLVPDESLTMVAARTPAVLAEAASPAVPAVPPAPSAPSGPVATMPAASTAPVSSEPAATMPAVSAASASSSVAGMALSEEQRTLLGALLESAPLDGFDTLRTSLVSEAINEAFIDELGDIVIEFDGDVPVLVEDYVDDVRAALQVV